MVLIQAAGRVLSKKNIDRLRAAFIDMGELLIGAGAVAPSELGNLFGEVGETLEESSTDSAVVQAGCLKDDFKNNAWQNNLKEALRLFEYRSSEIFLGHNGGDEYLNHRYGEGKALDKKAIAQELVTELGEILTELFSSLPHPSGAHEFIPYTPPPVSIYAEGNPEPEVDAIEAQSALVTEPPLDAEIVPDVSIDLELVFDRAIEVLAAGKGDASKPPQSANNRPIRGVLFRIDEPSETAPSKGSAYPLYIPKAVAEEALIAINASQGLPLDADPTLAKHANEKIVGIMVAAEIIEQDFIVQGHLFHWNQKDQVEAISTNQDLLGMSLNAHASGAVTQMDGKDVFCLSHLDILGANILLKDRATYQKTRLIPTEIAASSANENTEQLKTEEIDMEPLEQRIKDLQNTLTEIQLSNTKDTEKAEGQIAHLTAIVAKQTEIINIIEAERNQSQMLVAAQAAEKTKNDDMRVLISSLAQEMGQTFETKLAQQKEEFQAALLDVVNPSRVPKRITQPLVGIAAEGQQQQQSSVQRDRLIAAQAELATLEEHKFPSANRLGLIDEVRDLRIAMSRE
jgi:hypothetical protein